MYKTRVRPLSSPASPDDLTNRVVNQDLFSAARYLPKQFVDLLVLDPPYNLSKNYNGNSFKEKGAESYAEWFGRLLEVIEPTLAPNASIYVCSDWKTSILIAPLLEDVFFVRNRITWEREKGRGAKSNWKNGGEDVWFCTRSREYVFNVEAVKLKRKVVAPYRDSAGKPKDWEESENGGYRITHPSNIWTDITVPFWSMPENTDHPTQKPEKLVAKIVLASSNPNDFVFDPFLGSGTTAAVCKKLGRRYLGIERDLDYCCWAEKRLALADGDQDIQGFSGGVFWERNSLADQRAPSKYSHLPAETEVTGPSFE